MHDWLMCGIVFTKINFVLYQILQLGLFQVPVAIVNRRLLFTSVRAAAPTEVSSL